MNFQSLFRLLLVFTFSTALTTVARLGETEEQSKQRYGEPINKELDKMNSSPLIDSAIHHTYQYQGWKIRCAFVEGNAVRIVYTKIITKDVKFAIQDDELLAILSGEAGGGKWQIQPRQIKNFGDLIYGPLFQDVYFIHTNGNNAHLDHTKLQLTLESPAAAAFIKARDEKKERQRKASIPRF